METASLVLSVAQSFYAALQNRELDAFFSEFGHDSDLNRLEGTASKIRAVLLDAVAKEVLSLQEQTFVERLGFALYDADDLLDEVTTRIELENERHVHEGGQVSNKVRRFFNRYWKLDLAVKMSREIKKIQKTFDNISVDDGYIYNHQPVIRRREETTSFVYQRNIVGRDGDVEKIVGMLVDHELDGQGVFCLPIVGMGGLGKTTLAQLVYNHEKVVREFSYRMWVSVADQGRGSLDVYLILAKILESITKQKHVGLGFELVQHRLREQLRGKKYLLILDDVWMENRGEWLNLVGYLKEGEGDSKIVVTTRSKQTARIVKNGYVPYELDGLSDEDSWRLFEITVGQQKANDEELVGIGKTLVKKCANIPLAIKVIGNLLYSQEKKKWHFIQQAKITEICKERNDIMPILKFSYLHLSPSLKNCFTYCAIFPKDVDIYKDNLISLWIAQGYIKSLDGHQSLEEVGEEHFFVLLQRCFFQDIKYNQYGEIISCKIHDLMHDVAHDVIGKEICIIDYSTSNLDQSVRHLSANRYPCGENLFTPSKVRTFLCYRPQKGFFMDAWIANFKCLRALSMCYSNITNLPNAVGSLLHLRFLDLRENESLRELPNSITKLHNLQALILSGCTSLKELPKNFFKLTKLRRLDLKGCSGLVCMPPYLGKLTSLHRLNSFVVSGRTNSNFEQQIISGLQDLSSLKNLKGELEIIFKKGYKLDIETGIGCLNKLCLTRLLLEWPHIEEVRIEDVISLERMQPNSNIRMLKLKNYSYIELSRWDRGDYFGRYLPNLTHLQLHECFNLRELPWLGNLCSLRVLEVAHLENLEYIEKSSSGSTSMSGTKGSSSTTLSSLEELRLEDLPKLRGWSSMESHQHISFPRLSSLKIKDCKHLTSVFLCPSLQELCLPNSIEGLGIIYAPE